ncbi:MAG: aminopeptidase [Gemmatimonadetes bacterium]|nr:aminopeptidase [Gemmatimonadota bacterium]
MAAIGGQGEEGVGAARGAYAGAGGGPLRRGARVLVEVCAGVREREQVVVVCDDERLAIAGAVRDATEAAGGIATVVTAPPRAIDNQEPARPVAAAMAAGSVLFLPVSKSLSHTRATREAIAAGTRVVSMTAFTERMMREGGLFADFPDRKPLCDRMAQLLSAAREVRITGPAGTDLVFSVEGRRGNSHACIVREAGFTAVPNIEANTSPADGSTQGILVVDGSIPYYGVGVIREPVTFRISDGFVRGIEGGEQARFLRELLAAQEDPFVYNIAQFAIGLNPECREFTGEMLNDEGVNGTIHIGIGTSASLGGAVQAKTHFDAIIRAPSVWLDGEPVIREGELLVST